MSTHQATAACRERVLTTASGEFVAIRREYLSPPAPARRLIGKRLLDIFVASVALAVTAPLLLLSALAILIEDGRPVLFVHRRQTRGGRSFGCVKLRTMCRDAETRRRGLHHRNRSDGPQFHLPRDPRRWFRSSAGMG